MDIPKYHEFLKPFLLVLNDNQNHSLKEIRNTIAKQFHLDNEALSQLLPSGKQTIFSNRVLWAGTYLKKAGLIDRPSRAMYAITTEGEKVLSENPAIIDTEYLLKYPSFREFIGITENTDITANEPDDTPDYTFEEAFERINKSLADDLLSSVMELSPVAFEKMIIDLLKHMGYGSFENSGRTTPVTADEGIDGIIMEDKLGFNLIFIQAKHWATDKTVGRPEIQNFVGAISGKGGNGLFVTTAKYSKSAIEYADQHHIILIDGQKLCRLMIDHDFGVTVKKTFQVKEIDTDIFSSYDTI